MEVIRLLLVTIFISLSCFRAVSQELEALCKKYDVIQGAKDYSVSIVEKKYVIRICNDNDFQQLNSIILKAIEAGEKNIVVRLSRKTYHYKQNHISLYSLSIPDVSITIEGNDALIIPMGINYMSEKKSDGMCVCNYSGLFSPSSVFIFGNNEILDVWTSIRQALSKADVFNNTMADLLTDISGVALNDSKIRIPHWYYSGKYPILSISDDGRITFSSVNSNGFDKDYDGFSVINYDTRVNEYGVRYQCFNIENKEVPFCSKNHLYYPAKYNSIYECLTSHFIVIEATTLNQFKVTGLHCLGAQGDGHFINLSKVKAKRISFSKCHFKGIKNVVLMVNETDNVSFVNNRVERCFSSCVYSTNGSKNTIVGNSVFIENGQNMIQHGCVFCGGEDYHIYNNTFRDFPYAAISVGLHFSEKRVGACSGVIEDNEVYYTKEYFDNYWKYTLSDGGAIYISSYNDKVIIRNNYIHDYIGVSGNRAILGDTGAKNIVIYGNVIKNVPNYYAIDLYRVRRVDKFMPDANSGNFVFCNYIDGAYLIEGRDSVSCTDGGNILVTNTYNRYNTVKVSNSNTTVSNTTGQENEIKRRKSQLKRAIPTFKVMKHYIF